MPEPTTLDPTDENPGSYSIEQLVEMARTHEAEGGEESWVCGLVDRIGPMIRDILPEFGVTAHLHIDHQHEPTPGEPIHIGLTLELLSIEDALPLDLGSANPEWANDR